MPKSNAYLAWAVFLAIFALLCFQIRSCVLSAVDSTPRVEQPAVQQPTQEVRRPTLKRREPEVQATPDFPHPTIKQVDNQKYRVVLTKSDGWFDTKIPFGFHHWVEIECDESEGKFIWDWGDRQVFCKCPYSRGFHSTYKFNRTYGTSPDFRNTIKVKVFDESPVNTLTIYFKVNASNAEVD